MIVMSEIKKRFGSHLTKRDVLKMIEEIVFDYQLADGTRYSRRWNDVRSRNGEHVDLSGGGIEEFLDKNVRLPMDLALFGEDRHSKEA